MQERSPFADWLRSTRQRKRLTLAEVGRRAGHQGAYISIHEHEATRQPRPETVEKLARALADDPQEERRFIIEARRACGYATPDSDMNTAGEAESSPLGEIVNRFEEPLLRRITVNPAIFGGKPIIRGRRLAVEHVLGMLAAGDDPPTILEGYPWLEPDDLRACFAYARRQVAQERIEPLIIESAA